MKLSTIGDSITVAAIDRRQCKTIDVLSGWLNRRAGDTLIFYITMKDIEDHLTVNHSLPKPNISYLRSELQAAMRAGSC